MYDIRHDIIYDIETLISYHIWYWNMYMIWYCILCFMISSILSSLISHGLIWYDITYDIIVMLCYHMGYHIRFLVVSRTAWWYWHYYPNNPNPVESFNVKNNFDLQGRPGHGPGAVSTFFNCNLCPTGAKGTVHSG